MSGITLALPRFASALLVPLLVLAGACTRGGLMRPICLDSEYFVPAAFEGDYVFGLQGASDIMGNIPKTLDSRLSIIRNADGILQVFVNLGTDIPGASIAGMSKVPLQSFGICKRGNRLLLSNRAGPNWQQGDSISELFIYDAGITIAPLTIDFERAREAGFKIITAPGFALKFVNGNLSILESKYETIAILDNPEGSGDAILAMAKTSSLMVYLRRVTDSFDKNLNKPKRLAGQIIQ